MNMEARHLHGITTANDVKRNKRGISLTFDAASESMKQEENKFDRVRSAATRPCRSNKRINRNVVKSLVVDRT